MMSFDDLDFQFLEDGALVDYDYDKGVVSTASADSENTVTVVNFQPGDLLFGDDLNLASTLIPEDDVLACDSTDTWETLKQIVDGGNCQTTKQKSPWHESDSGMSESTYAGSPQSQGSNHEDDCGVHLSAATAGKELQNMESLNVDEVLDVESIENEQSSPVRSTFTRSQSRRKRRADDNQISNSNQAKTYTVEAEEVDGDDDFEKEHMQNLRFFNSTDYFSVPQKLNVVYHTQDTADHSLQGTEVKSRKNAIQAKINREKKKAYMKSLEDEIKILRAENTKLKSDNTRMKISTSDLEEEVDYLKSVLVNSSALSGLLKSIPDVKEVKLSATIVGRKRSVGDDHSYNLLESGPEKRARRINDNLRKAGVCLHVNGGSACLEFCAYCSKLAKKSSAL